MSVTVGLDFGTTNSAAAVARDGIVSVLDIGHDYLARTVRSVLFLDEERRIFVGQDAVSEYLATEGVHGRFLQSLKAYLPSPYFTETKIFGRRYELEDLIALIMREIRSRVEARVGAPVTRAVIGRPVRFSDDGAKDELAEKRLRESARRAGFEQVQFEYEPVAASFAYTQLRPTRAEQIVLMGDFGGGTSDFNVMRIRTGDQAKSSLDYDVLSIGGVALGGDTFDARIMWDKLARHFGKDVSYRDMRGQALPMPANTVRALCHWHQIPFLRTNATFQMIKDIRRTADDPRALDNLESVIRGNRGFFLYDAIEIAKKALSTEDSAIIAYEDGDIRISEPITRAEFNASIADDLARLRACIFDTLRDATLETGDIDTVLLTGGSSYVPAVRELFTQLFGADNIVYLDAFTSVAQGLALRASGE